MSRRAWLAIAILLTLGLVWFTVGAPLWKVRNATSLATAPADYALQDDSRVTIPAAQPHVAQPYNALKNVYWGELHLHTEASFDAKLFGTSLTVEDAYRFAKGEKLRTPGGELMQLSRPLDFVAITDHAESFGMRTRCGDDDLTFIENLNCWAMETSNVLMFTLIREMADGEKQPQESQAPAPPGVYQKESRKGLTAAALPICSRGEGGIERCYRDSISDWARYIQLADQYYEPGVLTTFAAYEYSPVLPDGGKHHRNVVFNGEGLPEHAISSMDVDNAIDLWRGLEENCVAPCDFLTIPHNMNKGWGLFYSRYTWNGDDYDEEGWRLRKRREPLAEMYQVTGASECALGVGATDEECAFGQVLKPCEPGQTAGCAFESSFARQGLKIGLELDRELGFNPFEFGLVAATDNHNANPGDAEEWDFVGKIGVINSPAIRRFREVQKYPAYKTTLLDHTSGGIAAVWAEENTRDAIFDGMKRREAYATSGPRMTLRFFAGWGFGEEIVNDPSAIATATAGGVPMGAVLRPDDANNESPTFFAWVGADLMSAPLQRVQVVKGWIDADGATHEKVWDVACSDGLEVDPTTNRCPDNGAAVDSSTCEISAGVGAAELITAWKDPSYDSSQDAFYYVRALQNPTCRWSTYDAIRLGIEPDPRVPASIRERVWSSPIWIDPAA